MGGCLGMGRSVVGPWVISDRSRLGLGAPIRSQILLLLAACAVTTLRNLYGLRGSRDSICIGICHRVPAVVCLRVCIL